MDINKPKIISLFSGAGDLKKLAFVLCMQLMFGKLHVIHFKKIIWQMKCFAVMYET